MISGPVGSVRVHHLAKKTPMFGDMLRICHVTQDRPEASQFRATASVARPVYREPTEA